MELSVVKKPGFKVIGVRRTTAFGGGTWAIVKEDGSNARMQEFSGRFLDLGLCFGFGADGSNDYMCAIEWEKEYNDGFDEFVYPEADWVRFDAKGQISQNALTNTWQKINEEWLPQSDLKQSGLPTMEKYVEWDEATDTCHVEIWIPVVEKKEKQ